jgi:hypothetical protein
MTWRLRFPPAEIAWFEAVEALDSQGFFSLSDEEHDRYWAMAFEREATTEGDDA